MDIFFRFKKKYFLECLDALTITDEDFHATRLYYLILYLFYSSEYSQKKFDEYSYFSIFSIFKFLNFFQFWK